MGFRVSLQALLWELGESGNEGYSACPQEAPSLGVFVGGGYPEEVTGETATNEPTNVCNRETRREGGAQLTQPAVGEVFGQSSRFAEQGQWMESKEIIVLKLLMFDL